MSCIVVAGTEPCAAAGYNFSNNTLQVEEQLEAAEKPVVHQMQVCTLFASPPGYHAP